MPAWLVAILSALVSSGLIMVYYNERLKRLGSYEQITTRLLSKMADGVHDVYQALREIHEIANRLQLLLEGEPYNSPVIRSIEIELTNAQRSFKTVLAEHRMYVTPLIPLGESSAIQNVIFALQGCLELFREGVIPRDKVASAARNYQTQFVDVKRDLDKLRKAVLAGEIIH
jgi:hypothetical protein